ncbi:hypothetical protein G7046_g6172 [Stylonectria norvegica]|nr:hypothetical protein G7046_g6172 [Stylonectria norvegica]
MRFAISFRLLFSLIALWAPSAVAEGDSSAEICFEACQNALHQVHFDDMRWNQTGLNKTCHSLKAMASLYLCLETYCSPEARVIGLGPLNKTCQESTDSAIPPFDLIANYSSEDIGKIRRVEQEDTNKSYTFFEVVLPSVEFFGAWFDTLDSVSYVNRYHFNYGAAMIVFWAIVVAIGVGSRLTSVISNLQIVPHQSLKPLRKVWDFYTWLSSSITVPATFGYRCAQKVGWGTVPPRLQSLTIFAFLTINVVFSIHGYRIVKHNLYFEGITGQILRYVSDRTGIISFANFPMIWLFGMRNNLLMWLTGWDFGTYSNFHRWVARIATVQAIIHSVGYTILILREGGWEYFAYWWTLMFWWAGELATIFMALLMGLSCYWIRRHHYETFLIIHIVMSIIILVAMLGHVSIFEGEYDLLFWIPALIWISDRAVRVLRVLAFNSKFWNTWGTATYSPSSNIIRLNIPWASSLYRPAPGTYYYLHVLGGPRFWESHPFTVASVLDCNRPSTKAFGEQVPLLEPYESGANSDPTGDDSDIDPSSMTFLIRPYDGFTSRLRETAAASWPRKVPVRVLVDGPYGHTQPFHLYDNVTFVVGGSGIVVPLSYLRSLTGTSSPRAVRIHWAVREPAFALEVLRNDIGEALGSSNLTIELHLTSHTRDDLNDWPAQVTVRSGRIDARSAIMSARAKADKGFTAVVACGPGQMADDARRTVVDLLAQGATRIEYFEESFQW